MGKHRDYEDPDFNAYLNDLLGPLEIGLEFSSEDPLTFMPSDVLARLDETAYRTELAAWRSDKEIKLRKSADSVLKYRANADRFEGLSELVGDRRIVPFVGAGLSVPAGLPGWGDFLIQMAEELGLSIKDTEAMLEAGKFEEVATIVAESGGRRWFTEKISTIFERDEAVPLRSLKLLPKIFPAAFVITTNFDDLLRRVFNQQQRPFTSTFRGRTERRIVEALTLGEHHLFKLHGDATDANCRVLTTSEYNAAYGRDEHDYDLRIPDLLRRIFMHHPLLFLGCSLLRDRTLRLFHEIAAVTPEGDSAKHFALLEEPETEVDWRARERFLTNCNIRPIWYPAGEHEYVEALLFRLLQHLESSL